MTELQHYGTPRHSGRYPWGSGDNPYQGDSKGFLGYVNDLHKQGLTNKEIATGLGMTTTQLIARKSMAKTELAAQEAALIERLAQKGYSNVAIGERIGRGESYVRYVRSKGAQAKEDKNATIAEVLKKNIAEKKYIDIGAGVENHLGVSKDRLKTAVQILKDQGYTTHYLSIPQLGTNHNTSMMVLAAPGVEYKEVYRNRDKVQSVMKLENPDPKKNILGIETPRSISSSRLAVRYGPDGGSEKDGVIELRRGVPEISLGDSKYAQVRVAVDDTHYLKGMAMYSDKLPQGVDVLFNTNKHDTGNKLDALKPMKKDQDNPFGAIVAQRHYIDANGKDQLSALNIVNEEGDWGKWSKNLSSQMLSKQKNSLAKAQLGVAYDRTKQEFDEIQTLTNPVVKKDLLYKFADNADAAAVHLKAAGLPRQATHVILPIPELKENEIYAPKYDDGESVVLIRHPHGGTFEIPRLTVNNKSKAARAVMDQAQDAVGIHPSVAARLSGADFDGDTVLVIPDSHGKISTSSPLKGLKDFDPKAMYPKYPGMKVMADTQKQMGDVSNLITDMTIKGASEDELARAVRHSMVVIDAEKHELNYKQSFIDNGIADLKLKYQPNPRGDARGGASTLISRAKGQARVNDRRAAYSKDGGAIDPVTGQKRYADTGKTYTDAKGVVRPSTFKSTKMAETNDAFTLVSENGGTPMEAIYATHANKLKALANEARKEALAAKPLPYSDTARKVYAPQVVSLKAKLNMAQMNAPLERHAQLVANTTVSAKRKANPNLEASEIKKLKSLALAEARARVGAGKENIDITDVEWEAIQAGAVSAHFLTEILNNTKPERIKELATPRTTNTVSSAMISRAQSLAASGRTQAEIARILGVSATTVNNMLHS